jgi:hypothetical protein
MTTIPASFPHPYAGLISVFDERVTATGEPNVPPNRDIDTQSAQGDSDDEIPDYQDPRPELEDDPVGGGDDDDESNGGGPGDDGFDEEDGPPGFVAEEEEDYILFAEREFEENANLLSSLTL